VLPLLTETMPGSDRTYLEMSSVVMEFDCQNTLRGVKGTDISCPSVDTHLLSRYLRYYVDSGFLKLNSNHSENILTHDVGQRRFDF